MKAEERKELKQNTLVATLEKVGHNLKEGPSRRTVVIGGVVLLVVLLFAVWSIASNVSASRNSKRWEELYAAADMDDLNTLVKENADTIQGRAARLQVARQDLHQGLGEIYDSYEKGSEKLRRAAESFTKLAKDFKATPILVQECLYGAGQAHEALGEFDEAVNSYSEVTKRYKESLLGKQAEQAAQRVKDRKTELEKIQQQLKKG